MTEVFTESASIDRPIGFVWKELTDWSAAPSWMAGIDEMSAGGPTAAGTTLRFRARGRERPSEIVAVEPERSVTLRSTQGGVRADYTYSLRSIDDDRTELTLRADCTTTGVWSLAGPLLRYAIRRSDRGQPAAFRRHVEGTS